METHFSPHVLAPTRGYRCELVRDVAGRAAAEALTDEVYASRLGLSKPRECGAETHPQQVVLLVRRDSEPVATMTMHSHAFESAAQPSPLELEARYDLETLSLPRTRLAEVRRMAVRPGQLGAVQALYAAATMLSSKLGIEHWIGLVEAQGELSSDATLVHRVMDAHGLLLRPLRLHPRINSSLFDEELANARSAYTAEQLRSLPVPPRVRAFARLFAARSVSVPSLHPVYRRIVVPMMANVADFKARWLPR